MLTSPLIFVKGTHPNIRVAKQGGLCRSAPKSVLKEVPHESFSIGSWYVVCNERPVGN